MKNQLLQITWVVLCVLSTSFLFAQNNVAINNTGAPPDSSAMLDVQSTEKGMLIPRMSTQQRELISNPAEGLLVYDSDTESFWLRQSAQWSELVSGKTGLRDMDDDTKVMVEETSDDDVIRFLAGGHNYGQMSWIDSLETNIGFDAGTNASSTAGTHFGYKAGYLDSGFNNTILGASAGMDTLSGDNNTFIGRLSGNSNQSGYSNSFIGAFSGSLNEGGYDNSFVGFLSGGMNTSGFRNSFLGSGAGNSNQEGIQNTFIGMAAGYNQNEGQNNTYLGAGAGQGSIVDTNGNRNTALGAFAGYLIGAGERNTMVGSYSGAQLTSGIRNTFLGTSSGYSSSVCSRNVFLGDAAGYYNTSGNSNTFVGQHAGLNSSSGNENTFIGQSAGYNCSDRSNLVALGDSALFNNGLDVTLSYHATANTAVGSKSLILNTIGWCNSAFGFQSMRFNVSGYNNAAFGYQALLANDSGRENTALGFGALQANIDGYANSATGYHAMSLNGSGFNNTAVGFGALDNNTSGSSNTAIGYNANVSSPGLVNATAIGANAVVNQNNSFVLGNNANVGIGNSTPNQLLSVGDDFGSSLTGNRITIGNSSGTSGLNIGEDIDNRGFILWNNSSNLLEMGIRSDGTSYGSTIVIKSGKAGINNSAPIYDLHVGDGNISATNGSDTRMVVSDNDNEDRAAILGLAKTSGGAKVEAQLEANGSSNAGPSVIVGAASSHPLYIRTGNLTRMTVTTAGDVGIGIQSPTEKLHVAGNICYSGSISACSDIRYKKNLIPVSDILPNIEDIGVYTYLWDTHSFPEKGFTNDRQLGVIAQELELHFPELVNTDVEGYKSVDYSKLSALLLQGIKEQQLEIRNLQEALVNQQREYDARLDKLEKLMGYDIDADKTATVTND